MNILEVHLKAVKDLLTAPNRQEVDAVVNNPDLREGVVTRELRRLLKPEYAPVIVAVAARLYVDELLQPEPSQEVLDTILANKEVGDIRLIECIQHDLVSLQTGIFDPGINVYINGKDRPVYPRFPNNTLDLSKLNLDGVIDDLWMGDVLAFDITKTGYHLDDVDMFGLNQDSGWLDYPEEDQEFYETLYAHKVKVKVILPDLSNVEVKRIHKLRDSSKTPNDMHDNILLVFPRIS